MPFRVPPYVIIAAVGAAAVIAVVRSEDARSAPLTSPPPPMSEPAHADLATTLPPNHPPIGEGSMAPTVAPAADERASLTWSVPAGWQTVANPNAMRLATYRVAKGDDAEVTVSRAGGAADANIERWVRQFDDAGRETREEKTIHGHKITIVEVSGTFLGSGMTPGAAAAPRRGWTLVGAIVEGEGSSYFFKMTGPTATVRAARAAFDAMMASVRSP